MIPRRRKAPRMGVRDMDQGRCPAHLKWVRGWHCVATGAGCNGKIQAHHVKHGEGAMGMKPPDSAAVAVCFIHHHELHTRGETTFEYKHRLDLVLEAAKLARKSSAWQRHLRKMGRTAQ